MIKPNKQRCRGCNEEFTDFITALNHICPNYKFKELWKGDIHRTLLRKRIIV